MISLDLRSTFLETDDYQIYNDYGCLQKVDNVSFVVFPRHEAVAAGFVDFEVGTAQERFHFAFLNN